MLRPIGTDRSCPGFFSLFLIPLVMLLLSAGPAGSVEEPPQQESSSFTNKDLEQYRPTAGENQPLYQQGSGPDNTRQNVHKRKTENQAGQGEQEHWCSKGRQARKKVMKARDEVEALKELITEFRNTEVTSVSSKRTTAGKNIRKTEKNLAAAQKRLTDKETLLAELEDDARRRNIPAGWTRCQFE